MRSKTVNDSHLSYLVNHYCYTSYNERGARKYWLLKPIKLPYKTKKAIEVQGDTTIKAGTLVVDAHWYLSTSDAQDRKSYKLMMDAIVTLPVASLVQEHDLEWQRRFRAPGASLRSLTSRTAG